MSSLLICQVPILVLGGQVSHVYRVPTGLEIWERVGNFILGFLCLERCVNFPWWLVSLFKECEHVKILRIYKLDHNLNTKLIGVNYNDNIWQKSQKIVMFVWKSREMIGN